MLPLRVLGLEIWDYRVFQTPGDSFASDLAAVKGYVLTAILSVMHFGHRCPLGCLVSSMFPHAKQSQCRKSTRLVLVVVSIEKAVWLDTSRVLGFCVASTSASV